MAEPFGFYSELLSRGREAHEVRVPRFLDVDVDFRQRVDWFKRHAQAHFEEFKNRRGEFSESKIEHYLKNLNRNLWYNLALLGYFSHTPTRLQLARGENPLLVSLERKMPPKETAFNRVVRNFPIFGISATALLSLGVPLPWNMVAGGATAALREIGENIQARQRAERLLKEEYERKGQDYWAYKQLRVYLNGLFVHRRGIQTLTRDQQAKNLSAIKRFHERLSEAQRFAHAYALALQELKNSKDASNALGFLEAHLLKRYEAEEKAAQVPVVQVEAQEQEMVESAFREKQAGAISRAMQAAQEQLETPVLVRRRMPKRKVKPKK